MGHWLLMSKEHIWSDEMELFQRISTNLHSSFKFTRKNEVDGCLPFLDVSLQRKSTSYIKSMK